jgi:glutamate dehydrogenase (NADP+)
VLESVGRVAAKHPEFLDQALIERICEPERQIIFRVP